MVTNRQPQKNKNVWNLFLNEYFQAISALILILFLVLAYFIFLQPRFSVAQEAIRANIDSEKNLYANNLKKLENYRAINEIYKKIDPGDLRRFNTVLPDNYAPEKLFGEIEEIVDSGGWVVGAVTIKIPGQAATATSSETSVGQNLGQYNLELTINAIDYAGFKSLLKILENNLRLFDITDVVFSPASSNAKITLTTYYYQRAQ